MKIRKVTAGLLVAGIALSACGREGSPAGETGGEGADLSYEVAENVEVEGSPTFEKMQQNGGPVIGVKDDQPGLGYKSGATNEYSGFDVEIARLVAAKLGFDPEELGDNQYRAVPSAGREQAIMNGDVDYYVGTYTINDERKNQISFAGPYYEAGQGLLVAEDNNDINGKDDLAGKKVCSVTGSTPVERVREEGLVEPGGEIVELQQYSQCIAQLNQGQVDAVTTDDAILLGYAAEDPENLKVVGETFSEEPYGIGLPKDDDALRDKVNDILQEAMEDGTWQEIYDATLGKSGTEAEMPELDRY
ncbi:ABC transporter substrate-binding protein [Saccharomonospora sp. CUA-673]|uniref:glutamate ABC transporter substrate-binding protein n=1 Tax=Saccharomonospora sp. CUA-673 TaxID=1904969 RepID=UPI000964E3F0|nr:glutamate ABC transporter substrate-binding protein [Saccharomonospora sp. CUA-673]OLT47109.1 ABC transporter substrate-binding protein [Saccharomonospora sp. CUA-673]